jgi:hypothetical protein
VAGHPIWLGGGSATPRPAVWGWPNHLLGPRGGSATPLGQTFKIFFEGLAQGGGQTTPLDHWGWLGHPQAGLRVAEPPPWAEPPLNGRHVGGRTTPRPNGVVQSPHHISSSSSSSSSSFFWIFVLFLNKICEWGILKKKKKKGQNGQIVTI